MTSFETRPESLQRAFGDVTSDADFFSHALLLGLDFDELREKRVLEIGTGRANRFIQEAPDYVDNCLATGVNPQLANGQLCQERGLDTGQHKGSVAALAQGHLPFRSMSFDTVISVMAVPKYLYGVEVPAFYNEVWRVLKPGGTARFWPLTTMRHKDDGLWGVNCAYARYEEVPEEILKPLHEVFHKHNQRMVLQKPDTPVPDVISELAPR